MNAQVESLRLPPHSVEAEQAVLGSLLLVNTAWDRVGDLLVEADFYRQDHRLVWRAISKLVEAGKPADVLTTTDALKVSGELDRIGGLSFLHNLASGVASAANIRRYAEIVRDRAIVRRLIEASIAITDAAYTPGQSDAAALLEDAEQRILAVGEFKARRGGSFRGINVFLGEAMENLDELHKNPNRVTGVATGFIDLDEQTTGLHPGDLVIVAGRPSMGKTAFAMNIAENVGVVLKLPVLVFSMEMGGTQLAQRMLGAVANVDSHRLRTGRLDQTEWDRLGGALGKLNSAPIEIDESGGLTAAEVRARARRKAREFGQLGLIVVDYLQLMQTAGGKDETRATQIGEITRSLKNLGKELRCPVVALSQLSREVEKRGNKRPIMSDLRDSGSIEQDADMVLFIYRDEVYNEETPDRGIAEIIIGKQRNGPIGTVNLTFLAKCTRFENYAGRL
jgi:replicative DNA helicase